MTNPASRVIIYLAFAGVAHLVERDLAKVEVASSSLVARSRKAPSEKMVLSFFCRQPRELAASTCAQRVKSYEVRQGSREWLLPFVGCREASSSLAARSKEHHLRRWCFLFFCRQPRELAASTCAQRVKSYEVRQGSREWPLPFVGCREASSSLVARSRKAPSEKMVLSFLQTAPRTGCLDLRAAREIRGSLTD